MSLAEQLYTAFRLVFTSNQVSHAFHPVLLSLLALDNISL